ncbi:MAG TPA: sugar phosphate isomerase/epimerase family protein [Edaphobacter sp.]|nr:sugar phosphate isomerase/epimerase family protein [Edaphobacter sp.]
MQRGISTHVFLQQRLHPGLLDAMHRAGTQAIEVFAARHHFDYTDRAIVREMADWFRSHDVAATLHQPLYADAEWSRHVAPTLNLIDPEKSRRIDAMDEVKRALEAAEQIPFRAITLHLGLKDDRWNTRAIENSLTAIEHLRAFAHPMGVQILLENLQNDVTTPEHLLEILHVGHFDDVGVTLDLGHAHLSDCGIDASVELLKSRIAELHIHDNQGLKDDHLWPGAGKIDWKNVAKQVAGLPATTFSILEIAYEPEENAESVAKKIDDSWRLLRAE